MTFIGSSFHTRTNFTTPPLWRGGGGAVFREQGLHEAGEDGADVGLGVFLAGGGGPVGGDAFAGGAVVRSSIRPSAPHREGGRTDGFISALRSRRLRYGTVKERKNWEGRFVGTIHAVNQPLLNKPYLLLSGYGGGCGTFTGFFVMAALISAIARLS